MTEEAWPRYDLLTHRARTTPDRTAVIDADTGQEWTYRSLDETVDDLAVRLDAAGVSLGTRVGVLLPSSPDHARVIHAIARLGGVLVPLDVRRPAEQLAEQAARAEVDILLCSSETSDLARELGIDSTFAIEGADDSEKTDESEDTDDVEALSEAASETLVPISRELDSLAIILFTSGTTGEPKGVRLTRRNLLASANGSAYRLGISPDNRWLCCLPMAHMGGLAPIFRSTLYGSTLVIQREFDASQTAAVIEEHSITGVSLVPTLLQRLLDEGWDVPEHLDAVLLGGAPASRSLIESCEDRDVPVFPTYGSTETASQIATARPAQAFEHPGTVGQPLVNTTVRIVDDGPVEQGETGEIVVSGPTVTPGYLDDDTTTAAVTEYGFHTGDLGYRDADGRLWIEGRRDERILSGGETVDPERVADAIRDRTGVEDAIVVGLPDEAWGERVAALVVGDVEAAEIREHCKAVLAEFEVPKTVVVTDALPRTASGTVDREAVRDRLDEDD